MAIDQSAADPFQLGIVAFPILAAVVGFAMNSVKDDDPAWYRGLVGGLGIATFIPATIFFYLAIGTATFEVSTANLMFYLLISATLVFFLMIPIVIYEINRGVESSREMRMTYSIVVFLLLLVGVVLHYFSPG